MQNVEKSTHHKDGGCDTVYSSGGEGGEGAYKSSYHNII